GYATPAHRRALRELGPSPIHRMSWAPIRAVLAAAAATT
ncbi:MAG TPA: ribonuclease HII, partial [Candidatus Dormibacteraeota bacterium]